jgi:tripartite-type tricarboxylate transporter receptor subunit TctC
MTLLRRRFLHLAAGAVALPAVARIAHGHPMGIVAAGDQRDALVDRNPDKLNFASSGVGASNHMSGELFKIMTGIAMTHVPYRSSGPALTDLIGGRVQVMFDAITSTIEHIRADRLRSLAVTSTRRSALIPDTPVIGDFVPGYEVTNWFGLGMPSHTPGEVIDRLNTAVNEGLADPGLQARFAGMGGTPLPGSPSDFGKLIADETEKWGKVIRTANIKPE